MNKTTLFFLLTLVFVLNSFKTIHKFYVSVTQVEYNEQQESLQIISRIFIDDIKELLKERYDVTIEVGEKEDTKIDEYLSLYISKKLKFTVNDKEVPFTFIGKEYEDDLIICYLEIEHISFLETIEVTNQILMDLFEEQQNIIHVKKNNQRKSLILQKEKHLGVLNFNK
ncbi:DUF6702 family protein [Aquimarina longa]|uniref:DUF6702 family protein n=1 Tax=Aquimarina longa TaxID=1080221 RepID=UPI0007805D34|nr:DUF6702 family protein [Aquimarina longa]